MGSVSYGDVGASSQQCRQSDKGHFCYETLLDLSHFCYKTLLDLSLELNSMLANFRMIGWGEERTIFVRRKNYDMLKLKIQTNIYKLIQSTPNDQMSVGILSKINSLS